MLDLEVLRHDPLAAEAALLSRGHEVSLSEDVFAVDDQVRALTTQADRLKEQKNNLASQVAGYYQGASDITESEVEGLKAEAAEVRGRIHVLDEERRSAIQTLYEHMLGIPNLPADKTPEGLDYEDFELIYEWGDKPDVAQPTTHDIIARDLGILDTEAGTKITGPRFSVLRGKGARLQRSLINFLLDHQTDRGYTEHVVPYIVNRASLTGTGQLPKFADDAFSTTVGDREMYLSPTAEVQLTNLMRDHVLTDHELPTKMTAYSENFRAEAGSAGRDTAGIFRQHQFPKIELVQICTAEDSWERHEELTFDAESALQALGLNYRKVALSRGDIGFASAFTYDLEVWLPGQGQYREVSSCSNFLDFQGRRMNARYVESNTGKKRFVHTVNGSGLAVGRTIVALLEQGLQSDGSVSIPEALQEYTKFSSIG